MQQSIPFREPAFESGADLLRAFGELLATSTRRDWEARGLRLWRHLEDPDLVIADLTDDAYAASDPTLPLVELSVFHGPRLLAKVAAASMDGGRAFIPHPERDRQIPQWHHDLCRVISPGEYFGLHPISSYLK
jgi:hypothetical protein